MAWDGESCSKCKRRMNVEFSLAPEMWKTVVLNRWRLLCPQCFDIEAEKAGVSYSFGRMHGVSWSERQSIASSRRRRR